MRYLFKKGRMVAVKSGQKLPRQAFPCIVGTSMTFSKRGNVKVRIVRRPRG